MTTTLAHIQKLSDLLELGLADLRKQEEAPNSRVDMNIWLTSNGHCAACLGGSVLRYSLGFDGKRKIRLMSDLLREVDHESAVRLVALNELRRGWVQHAADSLGVKTKVLDRSVREYGVDKSRWWSAMHQLLTELKAAGE